MNKPLYKIGDKVVFKEDYFTTISAIQKPVYDTDYEIYVIPTWQWLALRRDLRKATEQEISIYYK